jgi:F-type H+-transporting ATPase subunit gamma
MTERLADINARIAGVRQLGAVVNAMRGIAAARAQQARRQLEAVDAYAMTIAGAIGRTLPLLPARPDQRTEPPRRGLVVFVAEQGFAGAFSEHVLDAIAPDLPVAALFLVGTRGSGLAADRGIAGGWRGVMPSHSPGIPKFADRIADAVYARIAAGEINELAVAFTHWRPAEGARIERRRLFPLETSAIPAASGNPPLLYLKPEALLEALTADYVHAQLCQAALHAFAAENEARMQAMAQAHNHIDHRLEELQARQRQVRQEEITAEIIELSIGEQTARLRNAGPQVSRRM